MLSPFSGKAQSESPTDLFKTLEYRNVGPNRGGRSLAATGSPQRPNEYYFGATGGGLWKTTDGGTTWKPVTDGQIKSSSVGAVATALTNPDIVYIGMGESEFRGNIMQGDGVYKSTDAGKTWHHMGLEETQTISRIRVHPTNPDIVYAAALGHPFNPDENRGVYKTVDGGKTWKKILYKGDRAGAQDLIIDPKDHNTIYASIWEVYRTPWKMWGGGGASGFYKSSDGGETWEELTYKPGLPADPIGKIGITVSPVNTQRVWAIIEANDGGVFRSDDGGMTWQQTNSERKLRQRAFYYTRIYADPKDENGVYVLNVNFFKSNDGGKTFDKEIKVPHGDNHDLWIDPNDPLRMVEANDGGGTVSVNGGESWTDQDFPTAQLYHIIATNDFPYHVAGAQQDNSTIAVPSEDWQHMVSRTNSLKSGMGYAYEVGGGESGYIAQDPLNPDIFYAGSYSNTLTRINRLTGERRNVEPYPRYFMGEAAKTLPERVHWTFPIVFSPVNKKRLYVSSQHVWFTENEGQTWKKISPDLTLGDTATLGESGGVITKDMSGPEIYGTVYTLAPSFQDEETLWAGSDDGLVHITQNHGGLWENITPKDMAKYTRVSMIEASRHQAGKAYVAGKIYQLGDRAPYIWKTDDYGQTWTKIIDGIPYGDFVHVVREDPTRPGLLYAGTEHGIYVSFNDGINWHSLQLNLPDTQVPDIAVTEKDLAIATHGRSMYILDDIAPIREYSGDLKDEPLHLFTPYYAVRRVQEATFQYYLKQAVDSIDLEIFDAQGRQVQHFTGSSDTTKKSSLSVKAGLNTFSWDLRHPGATVFDGLILWSARPANGPLATPGKYTVKITTEDQSIEKIFDIKLDPRLSSITTADIEEQFKLAMQIRDEVSKANQAVIDIREIKTKIEQQKNQKTYSKLLGELERIESTIYQVKNQSNQDPLNYPIKLNNKLASLQRIVESGEAKPTDDSYTVFEELSAELAVLLNDLEKVTDHKLIKLL
ncbi:glycosyl hydrolase [Olivibacter sp. SDN3]|nr:glycosyl hydrolase [Olivibacter sp. SDN3]